MASPPGSSSSNSLSPPLAVSPPASQPMRLSVNPSTGVLELVPVHGGGGQQLVVSVGSTNSPTSATDTTSGQQQQHNVVNIAPHSGTSSVVNINSGGSGQVGGSNMRVVVEVKDEQQKDPGQRPVILSLGGGDGAQEIPLDDLCSLESLNGLLEKVNAVQSMELTDLQQLQAQQLKALFPGLANVCPQFIARIQKAAGPLFQAHLQQQQLQQQLEQQREEIKVEPVAVAPRKLAPLAPLSIKAEPDRSCILIDSDDEELLEQKPVLHSPSSTIPESEDLKLEDLSVEIGTTSRSRPCLKLRGYTYYQNRKFNDTVYWLCCEARDIKCKGKVTTDNYRIVKLYENHNHPNEDGHVSQPVVVSLGQKPPTYVSDKSSGKQRRDCTGALRASIASKRRRRTSSSDASPPPPPPPPVTPAAAGAPTPASSLAATPTGGGVGSSTQHLSLFPPASPPLPEFVTLSDYEELVELEKQDLGCMDCVQEVVDEYHHWHQHERQLVNTTGYIQFYPGTAAAVVGMYFVYSSRRKKTHEAVATNQHPQH